MRISLIVAAALNDTIGRDGALPWQLSADLQRFKKLTMGHALIMGRRTYESIGRPLPGRTTIVLSRQPESSITCHTARGPCAKVIFVGNLQEAFETADDDEEAFVIGGADVFRAALPRAQRIYFTRVQAAVDGDVRFPVFDRNQWQVVHEETHPADQRNDYPHTFQILDRVVQ